MTTFVFPGTMLEYKAGASYRLVKPDWSIGDPYPKLKPAAAIHMNTLLEHAGISEDHLAQLTTTAGPFALKPEAFILANANTTFVVTVPRQPEGIQYMHDISHFPQEGEMYPFGFAVMCYTTAAYQLSRALGFTVGIPFETSTGRYLPESGSLNPLLASGLIEYARMYHPYAEPIWTPQTDAVFGLDSEPITQTVSLVRNVADIR